VAVLLVAGAAVDQAADGGFTPLLIACQEGHDKVVAVLLAVNWPSVQQ
jgi:ankyrin repeat protein